MVTNVELELINMNKGFKKCIGTVIKHYPLSLVRPNTVVNLTTLNK